jgi:hypothetical protein
VGRLSAQKVSAVRMIPVTVLRSVELLDVQDPAFPRARE